MGLCEIDLEKNIIQNLILMTNDYIQYDIEKKKLIVRNIDFLINTEILFAKSYFKINPGFYKFRDLIFINFKIFLIFRKDKEKYFFEYRIQRKKISKI